MIVYNSETLATSADGQWRVQIFNGECPDEPYDDTQSPLLRIEYRYGRTHAEHIQTGSRPTGNDAQIEEAAEKWGNPSGSNFDRYFGKYLRAYCGVTKIETYHSNDYWYVTYDSAAWREWCGAPEGSADLSAYRAWCEGDVYGYVVERNVTWHREDDPNETMQTWESEDSCWGFYGYKYAKESALEAFKSTVPKPAEKNDITGLTPEQLTVAADIRRVSELPPIA